MPQGRDACLLVIGNDVTVSSNVTFLLHDNAIIKPTSGRKTDLLGRIIVGDHSFVGCGSILLPGVVLAEKTIVGAGSVVTKSVLEPGLVIAGNPASIIGTVEDYLQKNLQRAFNLDGVDAKGLQALVLNHEGSLIKRPPMTSDFK